MNIKVAKEAGFCHGVKSAIDLVDDTIKNSQKEIFILGPLIHNPQVAQKLEDNGVTTVEDIESIPDFVDLIIRAHGVSDSIIAKAKLKNCNVLDAICPNVKQVHKLSKEAELEGYFILLFGEKDHPEIMGIKGNLSNFLVFETIEELEKINMPSKVCLLSQTTQSGDKFQQIVDYIHAKNIDFKCYNTICNATYQRQKAATELAKESDLMIVIGGKTSGNTKRLFGICNSITKSIHIETAKELNEINLSEFNNIGITAGASTPDWIIKEVIDLLSKSSVSAHE